MSSFLLLARGKHDRRDRSSSPQAPGRPCRHIRARILTGLVGVLAVILAGLNENVTKMALADIRGAWHRLRPGHLVRRRLRGRLGLRHGVRPWCSVTFSLRRFTTAMLVAFAVFGALSPFARDYPTLLALRTLVAGGACRRC